MIATDGRYRKDLVAGDVKAAAFGAQTAAELLVTGRKGHYDGRRLPVKGC